MKECKVGDTVRLRSLKKTGEVVERLRSGRYRVSVGALSITCGIEDLEPIASSKTKQPKALPIEKQPAIISAQRNRPSETLDLHGKTVNDALVLLASWLDKAILADLDRVTVIHGHGTGRVQKAVHSYLATIPAVKNFRINEMNSGETLVYL